MGNSGVEESLAGKGKKPEQLAGQEEEERRVLEEKLYCTRLELQKTRAVSADADETICRLAAASRRMAQERDEAWNQRNALLAELHARRNAQMMMALAAGPHRSFAGYSSRALFAPAPFGGDAHADAANVRAGGRSQLLLRVVGGGQRVVLPQLRFVDPGLLRPGHVPGGPRRVAGGFCLGHRRERP